MEHIVSFLPGQLPDERRFSVELTGITFPDKNYHILRARSSFYCLEYVMGGRGLVRCGGKEFSPGKGDVYLLPAGMRHEYRSAPDDPFEKIWMNVRGDLCDGLYRVYGLSGIFYFPGCPVYPLFRRFLAVCESYQGNGKETVELCSLLFHEILISLSGNSAGGTPPGRLPERKAKEFMDLHVREKLTMESVARESGLSPSQLTRAFHKQYGVSPYRYFLDRKLVAACALLKNTGMQVREIAYLLKFTDEHYFSTLFREKIGVSPSDYRNGKGKTSSAAAVFKETPGK